MARLIVGFAVRKFAVRTSVFASKRAAEPTAVFQTELDANGCSAARRGAATVTVRVAAASPPRSSVTVSVTV